MLLPSTPVVQIGELKIQSEYTRPATVQEAAPEVHNPILDQVQLDKIKTKQKEIKPLQAKPVAKLKQVSTPKPKVAQTASTIARRAISGNGYSRCQCTFYAKSRRPDLPNNLGNANTWFNRAAAQGYSVGYSPRVGAIGEATSGTMHVVFVEAVKGDQVVISEWNFKGPCVLSYRTVHKSAFRYIY